MQKKPADRIGRAAAVVEDFREVRITVFDDILAEGIQQVVEQLQGQAVLADDARHVLEKRVLRIFSLGNQNQIRFKCSQLAQARLGRVVALVGEVVRSPGEAVNDADRVAQCPRQQEGRNREVLVMADRHLRAIIRCFS